jgi:hypothetical protein
MEDNLTQIPDASSFIGKDFIFEDTFKTDSNISFCAGVKFKIVKIDGCEVSIKIISTIEECEPAIRAFSKIVSKDIKSEIKVLDKVINIWKKDRDKFIIDNSSVWNKRDNKNGIIGHCINTGFKIPKNHPNSSGSVDGYITADYKHVNNVCNLYSYQNKRNVWYSQECYEFMRLSKIEDFNSFDVLTKEKINDLYKTYYKNKKYDFTISNFNKNKFKKLK